MMANVLAEYNDGRWIVKCPEHGDAGAVLAEPNPDVSMFWAEDGQYICPVCYPHILKTLVTQNKRGVKRTWDRSAQHTARLLARAEGKIYDVIFPDNKKQIEDILATRPPYLNQGLIMATRNWRPGETLEDLLVENELVKHIHKGGDK